MSETDAAIFLNDSDELKVSSSKPPAVTFGLLLFVRSASASSRDVGK